MPTFDTPNPINVAIQIGIGDITVTASERSDTVVTISPRDASNARDMEAARDATAELTGLRLRVRAKTWRRFTPHSDGAVIVAVELPHASSIDVETGMGEITCTGELAGTGARTGMGSVNLERTGKLRARTGMGDVRVVSVAGEARVATGSGSITIGEVTESVNATTSTGDISVESADGDVDVRTASGAISVQRAARSVRAHSAAGAIRIDEVSTGSIHVRTSAGSVDIGVRAGSAAWVDLNTQFGTVRNNLTQVDGPEQGDDQVKVRVRTAAGDITVQRAELSSSEAA